MAYRRAVSLFSNCGAGDVGYRDSGFRFDVMAELDQRRLEVSLLNHRNAVGVPGDLRETWPTVVKLYRRKAGQTKPALLSACPPCQGMSTVRSGRGKEDDPEAGSRDKRNLLVVVIAKVAVALKPKIIVVENVPAFLRRQIRHPRTGAPVSAAKFLVTCLAKDYHVFPLHTDLCDFGVPQSRKRVFLTFIRRGIRGTKKLLRENRAPYPRPTHVPEYDGEEPIHLRRALQEMKLPSLDGSNEKKAKAEIAGGMHFVPVWEPSRYRMVQAIPANSGRSAWENNACEECGEVDVKDEDAICPICNGPLLRPVVSDGKGNCRLIKGFRSTSYRRMPPDVPASTITTASGHIGSSFTIHPWENRLLSPLECQLLQTIPNDFVWGDALEKWGQTNVRDMIGEAVPPRFTRLHGSILAGILGEQWTKVPISLSDERCTKTRKFFDK